MKRRGFVTPFVLCLLAASVYLGLEVTLAVRSFDEELDLEIERRGD